MADPVAFRLTSPDVPADVDEQTAFDGHEPYTPTYCDFEAWEEHGEPPRRSWAIDGWLGMGHVTLLSAKGGMGKSILALQMATALGLGLDFVGKIHQPRVCLVWMGEDEDDELWRRQTAVSKKVGRPLSDLRGRVFLESMATEDCTLVCNVHGAGMIRTGMLKVLREQVGDLKADVVMLDNIARLFAGNENDRHEVTAFMSALVYATAPTNAATLLVGHIAKAQGSEYSGSAAWENSARARLWFTDHPPDKEPADDDGPPDDLRYLAKRKVNYTSRDLVTLRYVDDAYDVIEQSDPSGVVATIKRANCRKIVVAALMRLAAMGIYPTESTASPNYMPRLILQYNLGEKFSKQELAQAMRALMAEGTIKRAQVGRYSNSSPKYGLVAADVDSQ